MRLHIAPTLGGLDLVDITPARVRSWRAELLRAGLGAVTVAKAYRLLRTIMQTAVEDRLIGGNPCQIRGASVERSPERPTLTIDEVYAIANAMPGRYRLLVLLATFCSLRWGELAALTRANLDAVDGWVHVRNGVVELKDGSLVVGAPKSAAGRRVVAIPTSLLREVRDHLKDFVKPEAEALVFVGPEGGAPRRSNFQHHWNNALREAGVSGVHFHDLRHTGNTLTAQAGATLSDLMARMGHSSPRAAQIYLHTTSQRDRAIADLLDGLVRGKQSAKHRHRKRRRRAQGSRQAPRERARGGHAGKLADHDRSTGADDQAVDLG